MAPATATAVMPIASDDADAMGVDEFDAERIDPGIQCARCQAVCCRLTVLVMPDDPTPARYIARDAHGMEMMARSDDGWCVALDRDTMRCGIYALRPQVCRDFRMGGDDCRMERAAWQAAIPVAPCR